MTKKIKEPKFDADLLVDVLSIQSSSKDDTAMMSWLKEKIKDLGILYTLDLYGNIYITKGKADIYPCLVAHTDCVQPIKESYAIFEGDDVLFAFDSTTGQQAGIGGDDKNGLFICLNALQDLPVLKVVLFRHEEIGCLGSRQAEMGFFDDCSMVLQADRRGNADFINVAAGVELSSDAFMEAIKEPLKQHQYKECRGSVTDVMTLKQRGLKVCAANMSCGYWAPHTEQEVVYISEVEDCYGLIIDIFALCGGKKWPHTYTPEVVKVESPKDRYGYLKSVGGVSMPRDYYSQDEIDRRQLQIEFEAAAPWKEDNKKMKHDHNPIVDLDNSEIEDVESALEEMEVIAVDLKSAIEDFETSIALIKAKSGKI